MARQIHWVSSRSACPGLSFGMDSVFYRYPTASAAPPEAPSRPALPQQPEGQGEFRWLEDRRFFASVRVAGSECTPKPGQPVGVEIKVGFHEEYVPAPLVWPPQEPWDRDAPMAFGDPYAAEPAFRVEEKELESGPPLPALDAFRTSTSRSRAR